jgi:hypothetical protein
MNVPVSDDIRNPGSSYTWNNGAAAIKKSMENGEFLLIHRGHGGIDSWGGNGYTQFSSADVDLLTNSRYTPVVLSLNCLTGKFDEPFDCISEKFVKKVNGGAVGVIAATDETETIYNDHLAQGLTDEIWSGFLDYRNGVPFLINNYGSLRMGDVLRGGLLHIAGLFASGEPMDPGAQNAMICYQWLGDPTMEILPYPTCSDLRNLNSITVNQGDICLFDHTAVINVDGTSVVKSGGESDFRSGDRIIFKPGFKVCAGAHMRAKNEACYIPPTEVGKKAAEDYPYSIKFYDDLNNEDQIGNLDFTFSVYPNPSHGVFYIDCQTDEVSMNFEIYNLQGACIYKGLVSNGFAIADLTACSKGVYIIKFLSTKTVKDFKISIL